MSKLSDYTQLQSFTLNRPGNSFVTFAFDTDDTRPGLTQVTLPQGSRWRADPHWHEDYVENLRVIKGRALISLNGRSSVVTPDSGTQIVEKFAIHEFMRADRDSNEKDEGDVVIEEWTDPADGMKHVFFRNVFSTLKDSERYWKSWTYLQALLICAVFDNYIVIVPGPLSRVTTYTFCRAVRGIGFVLGLRPWYPEYTPEHLRAGAERISKGH